MEVTDDSGHMLFVVSKRRMGSMEALCNPGTCYLRLDFGHIPKARRAHAIEAIKHLSVISSLNVTITEASHHAMILAMNQVAGLDLSRLKTFEISGMSVVYMHSELLESFMQVLDSSKDALESIKFDVDAATPVHASMAVKFSRGLEALARVSSVRLACSSIEWHEEKSLVESIGRMPNVKELSAPLNVSSHAVSKIVVENNKSPYPSLLKIHDSSFMRSPYAGSDTDDSRLWTAVGESPSIYVVSWAWPAQAGEQEALQRAIASSTSLRELNLSVTDDYATHVRCGPILDGAMRHTAGGSRLRKLEMVTRAPIADTERLPELLHRIPSLRSLAYPIGVVVDDASSLIEGFASPSCGLRSLSMQWWTLPKAETVSVCKAIAANESLKTLDARGSALDEGEFEGISAILRGNASIEHLEAHDGYSPLHPPAHVFEALAVNDTLRRMGNLHFDLPRIGADAVPAMCSALRHNCSLQQLTVRLSTQSRKLPELIDAMQYNRSVTSLVILDRDPTRLDIPGLVSVIRSNVCLRSVSLSCLAEHMSVESLTMLRDVAAEAAPGLLHLSVPGGGNGGDGDEISWSEKIANAARSDKTHVVREWMAELESADTMPKGQEAIKGLAGRASCALRMLRGEHRASLDAGKVVEFAAVAAEQALNAGYPGGCILVSQAVLDVLVEGIDLGMPVGTEPVPMDCLEGHGLFEVFQRVCIGRVGRKRGGEGGEWVGAVKRCVEVLSIRDGRRRRRMVRWRRAAAARRDAARMFRAAAEGRPLELAKRMRLGVLAGGLEAKGEVGDESAAGGTRLARPLEAARIGGHEECVRLLAEVSRLD